ncbi:MAG: aminoacyl-tRNA hydrolase [Clostridiales bacterium]|nr:aminoacyl-tRNA hydrolase [Clostridiales bacterium]MBQ3107461.1 aminoacyl-tRNA hydrolase [Bacillota bacterium]
MYIIAGLGNPGREYENTKHNIGFITLDHLAEEHGIRIQKIKHKALVGEGYFSGQKVLLVKPQTYMNLSGESLREIMSFYKVPVENLIVVYDDIDLPMGGLRIRANGSAGTHNGMRSIVANLKSEGFPRVRVGIGGGDTHGDLAGYVLGGFSKEQKELMEEAVKKAAAAVTCMVTQGVDKAMNRYNVKAKTAKKKKEAEEVNE